MTVAFINKDNIIKQIKQGNEDALVGIYQKYKPEFIAWAVRKFHFVECEDIYQDAILVFRGNIVSNRLIELNSSVKTYLFAVAKNIALKRKNISTRQLSDSLLENDPVNPVAEMVDQIIACSERQKLITAMIEKLKEPNRSILKMYYYQNLSMREIAEKLNYKNDKVVKAQKVRCMNELKKMVKNLCLKDDLKD